MQKTNRMPRLLALVMAVALALACLPVTAFADDAERGGHKPSQEITVRYRVEQNGDEYAGTSQTVKQGESVTLASVDGVSGWKHANTGDTVYNPGDSMSYDELDKLATSGKDKTVNFYAVVAEEPTLKTIHLLFMTAADQSSFETVDLTAGQSGTVPTVAGIDYWTLNGTEYQNGSTVTFDQMAAIVGENFTADGEAWLSFAAGYKPVATLKTIQVKFLDANGSEEIAGGYTLNAGETNVVPDAVYPGKGEDPIAWKLDGVESQFTAGQSVTFEELAKIVGSNFDGNGNAVLAFLPVYGEVKPEEPTNKTLKIYWATDGNATFADNGQQAWTETIAWSDKDNTFVIPELNIDDGYKLAGWEVSGTESNQWAANATTFGLTGLIVENDNGGSVAITAKIVKDDVEPTGKTLKIYWATDGNATFADNGQQAWTETIAWSDKDNTFVIPTLNIDDGYKLAGWSVSGTQGNYWAANATTFGLTGLIVEDENGGYVSITANVVGKDEPVVPEEFRKAIFQLSFENAAWTEDGYGTNDREYVTSSKVTDKVVAPDAAMDGYTLKHWVCTANDKVTLQPGEEFNFADLGAKGLGTEIGDFAFIPVFEKAAVTPEEPEKPEESANPENPANPEESANPEQSANPTEKPADNKSDNKGATAEVVKSSEPADTTAKVIPQTGAANDSLLLVGGVSAIAVLLGGAVYMILARKKEN